MDVAQVLLSEEGAEARSLVPPAESPRRGAGAAVAEPGVEAETCLEKLKDYLERAVPLVTGKDPANQQAFLLVPASEAGRALGEGARAGRPGVKLVRVPGHADLMVCREQGFLGAEDLQHLLRLCHPAYAEAVTTPQTTPHARADILDWLPLDP